MRLLLVEDDRQLGPALKGDLTSAGFATDLVDNGVDAQFMGEEEPFDVAVLDLGLPKRPGLEVLRNWRKKGVRLPVIILTARDGWHEKVEGFQAGADDYLAKPFHVQELIARIHAVIRRSHQTSPGGALECGGLVLDEERQSVRTAQGEALELTGTEFRLLRFFMLNPGKLLSKTRLTEHVYEYDEDKDSNVMEVYIRRLRLKLGHDRIETRRGQGYIFRA